jgi:catechol 2,3-dioxygenase-like lactoylglutathione lyase family enzyme
MISSGLATVYVADIDRAIKFYVETLGFKLQFRAPGGGGGAAGGGWAEIDTAGGLVLGLHVAGAHGPQPGAAGSISIGFQVNQPIREVVAVLENRGVKFRGPIREDGPVKLAFFSDPDGTALYLAESPAPRG